MTRNRNHFLGFKQWVYTLICYISPFFMIEEISFHVHIRSFHSPFLVYEFWAFRVLGHIQFRKKNNQILHIFLLFVVELINYNEKKKNWILRRESNWCLFVDTELLIILLSADSIEYSIIKSSDRNLIKMLFSSVSAKSFMKPTKTKQKLIFSCFLYYLCDARNSVKSFTYITNFVIYSSEK